MDEKRFLRESSRRADDWPLTIKLHRSGTTDLDSDPAVI
jgi:hypothetical protein